jgi:hypothetical protein
MSVEVVEVEIPFAGIEAIEVEVVTAALPGLGTPIISATPPTSPVNGMQWIEEGTNILSVWFASENSWIVPATNAVPANALTFDGEILTFGGEILTFAAA